jgi:hypothetical protein
MKSFLTICLACLLAASAFAAKIPFKPIRVTQKYNKLTRTTQSFNVYSIHQINTVPLDSLKNADSIQTATNANWASIASPVLNDTVVFRALVVVPSSAEYPNAGLTFTQAGWTFLLHDTLPSTNEWGGLLIRVLAAGDTTQAGLDGFNNVELGDEIEMTGIVQAFPTPPSNTATFNYTLQVAPLPGNTIEIISSNNPIPPPTFLNVAAFYSGAYPGGTTHYSGGDMYQSSLVELTNLKVNAIVNSTRGTWQMTDSAGNYISDYDGSHFFTFGNNAASGSPGYIAGDPGFALPPVGATVTSIKGTITTVSGGENPRGYRIVPLFQGDVVLGVTFPSVTAGKRVPITVGPLDPVVVSCDPQQLAGGYQINTVAAEVSVNYGSWQTLTLSQSTDTTYSGTIVDGDNNPYPAGTNVRYFFTATDMQGNQTILANPSSSQGTDTSRGFFWYTVKVPGTYTIHDIQYTPYLNGLSPYNGGRVTVTGIVTAGDSDILPSPKSTGGTTSWYIQSGSGAWNGIWVLPDTEYAPNLDTLTLGDSVSIAGFVDEDFDVTAIEDSSFTIFAHNRPVPAPAVITTGTFGLHLNGDPTAEPYEGVLIRVINATVTNVYPIYSDETEYEINDGSGPMIVERDGNNTYSNELADTTQYDNILSVGDVVDTITGIGYFSYNRYKIVPRRNSDYVVGAPTQFGNAWNLISVGRQQIPASTGYNVSALFPTAVTSAFSYANGYHPAGYLVPGTGYWIKFPTATTTFPIGPPIAADTISVNAGWNLIGAIGSSISTSAVHPKIHNNGFSNYYGYNRGYVVATTLNPWQGYWVKVDSTDTLYEEGGSKSSPKTAPKVASPVAGFSSVTLSDGKGNSQTLYFTIDDRNQINLQKFEMPPALANADFDARYASNRILETYPSTLKAPRSFGIQVHSSTNAPLTVSWDLVGHTTMSIALQVLEGGKVSKSIEMTKNGSAKGISSASGSLALVVAGVQIPRAFSLSQNYPNPFNPTTRIDIGLPVTSNVHVAIYNILGQKIATISDGYAEAGMHTYVWNGQDQAGKSVATGVYFVRMSAGTFTATKKMLLMK